MKKGHIDLPNKTASELNQSIDHTVDTSLTHLISLSLTKQQWIIIFNLLVNAPLEKATIGTMRAVKYGVKFPESTQAVIDILDKIEPYVAQLSDKDVKKVELS